VKSILEGKLDEVNEANLLYIWSINEKR
jgi:hypothetical protein